MNLKNLDIDEELRLKLDAFLEEFECSKNGIIKTTPIQENDEVLETITQVEEEVKESFWDKFYRLAFVTEYEVQ